MATNNDSTTVILLCNTASQASIMCFFNTVPTAEDNEAPADTAFLSPPTGGFITWEGQSLTGTFANHLLFTTQIQGNAFSQPLNTKVGTGYHSPPFAVPAPGDPAPGFNVFGIFKDNGRVVYTDPVLGDVVTLYYCVANGQTVAAIPDFVPIP